MKLEFFHQTNPSGPIRGSLDIFLFLAIFHRAIQILKRLPGVRDTKESRIATFRDTRESGIAGIMGTGKLQIPQYPRHRGVIK